MVELGIEVLWLAVGRREEIRRRKKMEMEMELLKEDEGGYAGGYAAFLIFFLALCALNKQLKRNFYENK